MAQRLHRVNSWAVTGTPVGNTASTTKDLYGLFTFLKLADEYQAVADVHPDSELAFIKRYMIRNSKASVRDELHLPAQRENLVMVEFSEIEREFYARVRAAVMRDFKAVMEGREVQQVRGYQRTVTFGGCLLHLRQTWYVDGRSRRVEAVSS